MKYLFKGLYLILRIVYAFIFIPLVAILVYLIELLWCFKIPKIEEYIEEYYEEVFTIHKSELLNYKEYYANWNDWLKMNKSITELYPKKDNLYPTEGEVKYK